MGSLKLILWTAGLQLLFSLSICAISILPHIGAINDSKLGHDSGLDLRFHSVGAKREEVFLAVCRNVKIVLEPKPADPDRRAAVLSSLGWL